VDLPRQLRALAAEVEAGSLSPAALERLRRAFGEAHECALRDSALRRAGELLDPDGRLSRNARSERLASALARFEGTAWPRISRGLREPRSELEAALCEVLACSCPRSPRRIRDVI
jgi:hypothetical protein